MGKLWLMAKHEYLRMVRKRSFLLSTLGIPALIVVITAVSIYVAIGGDDDRAVGYVDQAGLLSAGPGAQDDIEMRAFAGEEAARAALAEGEVQAVYVVPQDYMVSGRIRAYYWEEAPGEVAREAFEGFVRSSLAASLPEGVRERVTEGVSLIVRSADGRREVSTRNMVGFLLPFAAGIFFVIAVMTSAGYLLQAVTTEKENRTMEVMVTSMTPEELIGGKALGLISVSLTQLLIWLLTVIAGLIVGAQFVEQLRVIRVPWALLGIIALYFFPAFGLVAGMMTAIGSAVTETRQGQQISGVINLLFIAPFFFLALILANPNSPVVVALTLFPTTAFITVTMRWGLTVIPLWQLVLSWLLLVSSAGLSVWAAARILRAGMLRYGQRLTVRAMVQAVRAGGIE